MKMSHYFDLMNKINLQPTYALFLESNHEDLKELNKRLTFKLFYDKVNSKPYANYVQKHDELRDIYMNRFSYGFHKYC
jgi:hypothetical protein